jgi:hypothetical protein
MTFENIPMIFQKTGKEYLLMILPCRAHGCHLNLKTVQFLQLGFGFIQMMGLRYCVF